MKTFTIRTNRDDDEDSLIRAILADKAFEVLWDIDQDHCRRNIKYNDKLSEDACRILEGIREAIYESGLMEYYN